MIQAKNAPNTSTLVSGVCNLGHITMMMVAMVATVSISKKVCLHAIKKWPQAYLKEIKG
jgi:hypothetical protein